MRKYLLLTGVLFSSLVHATSKEGCYSFEEAIFSAVSEESALKETYVQVSKVSDQYFAEGVIWGANFHICHLSSPSEGPEGPLPLKVEGDNLVYEELDPEYNINCKLEISFADGALKISDNNHHCSNYIFSCGARVGLNDIELPKSAKECPVPLTY